MAFYELLAAGILSEVKVGEVVRRNASGEFTFETSLSEEDLWPCK